jgi:hypothetical protein
MTTTTTTANRAALDYLLATDAYPTPAPAIDPNSTASDRLSAEANWLKSLSATWREILEATVADADTVKFAEALEILGLVNDVAAETADGLRALGEHEAADVATGWCEHIIDGPDWHI